MSVLTEIAARDKCVCVCVCVRRARTLLIIAFISRLFAFAPSQVADVYHQHCRQRRRITRGLRKRQAAGAGTPPDIGRHIASEFDNLERRMPQEIDTCMDSRNSSCRRVKVGIRTHILSSFHPQFCSPTAHCAEGRPYPDAYHAHSGMCGDVLCVPITGRCESALL